MIIFIGVFFKVLCFISSTWLLYARYIFPKLFINLRKSLEVNTVSVSTIIIVLGLILNDMVYMEILKYILNYSFVVLDQFGYGYLILL